MKGKASIHQSMDSNVEMRRRHRGLAFYLAVITIDAIDAVQGSVHITQRAKVNKIIDKK